MNSSTEQKKLWDNFLVRWSPSDVQEMEYKDYSSKGSHDSFCYWVEFKTKKIGSISGSSAFKFGVYSRSEHAAISTLPQYSYSDSDAWQTKYGKSAEEAFQHVKKLILEVITHAQQGNLEAIQKNTLSSMVKWKIAFLYQNQASLCISNIFTPADLQLYTNEKSSDMCKLNRNLFASIEEISTSGLFDLGKNILEHATKHKEEISETGYLLPQSKNIILYGPPGTGKTHALINGTVDELQFISGLPDSQVRSVTFHPSYGYEDFVEGIQPVLTEDAENPEGSNIQYIMRNGVFKEIVYQAELENIRRQTKLGNKIDVSTANAWKLSLGNTATEEGTKIFNYCTKNGKALLGFIDQDLTPYSSNIKALRKHLDEISGEQTVTSMMIQFCSKAKIGDLFFVTKGNKGGIRAIGQITSDYEYIPDVWKTLEVHQSYRHARSVKWLWVDAEKTIPSEKLFKKNVSQRSIYSLNGNLDQEELQSLFTAESTDDMPTPKNFVLKIDEINRGNVSKIFGELITLIEEDKRGYPIQLASGTPFSVPENLFIIGTMNTADRSLTHLDTALRRRFHFIEMMPQPALLGNTIIDGIDLTELLTSMNERMEALIDREHTIGHGYFMQNEKAISTIEELQHVIMNKVLPQLQEYFFDDYAQIQLILGEEIVKKIPLNVPSSFPMNETYRIIQLENDKFIDALKKAYSIGNTAQTPTEEQQSSAA